MECIVVGPYLLNRISVTYKENKWHSAKQHNNRAANVLKTCKTSRQYAHYHRIHFDQATESYRLQVTKTDRDFKMLLQQSHTHTRI